ncbi:MAG: L-serine ammonia-lyase, iron-sulfur-dependent subunit beta [Thermosediminibacteraceae bacterium]|nr:L-serine ammonia-lyase, iron-sulfur-dependent subunit beta [Thermosediminibacteraceae bacterium]
MDLFDIIGPVMIGPSSSHTAGAVKLGNLARNILGEEPKKARIILYNSFAKTGRGHGTDKAVIAGILGFGPDDERIKIAFEEAKKRGLVYQLLIKEDESLHPNTVTFELEGASKKTQVTGCSIGGGRVKVTAIDGFEVELSGEYSTIITVHKDRPGIVARVTAYLAEWGINIAEMRVSRKRKGEEALMVIETDEKLPGEIKEILRNIEDIYRVITFPE